jgi:hypothetical protein
MIGVLLNEALTVLRLLAIATGLWVSYTVSPQLPEAHYSDVIG